MMKRDPDADLPDFLAWRQEGVTGEEREKPLYSVLATEVKYRANPEEFLRREASQILSDARQQISASCSSPTRPRKAAPASRCSAGAI